MTFLPVVHPVLIAGLVLPVLGIAIWSLFQTRRLAWIPRILLVLAIGVLALRPGLPDGASQQATSDVDVFLLVDSTTSITAEDWGSGEQRLAGVRDDVRGVMAAYPGARFGLLTFDNVASVRLPLTTDRSAVMASLEVLRPPATPNARGTSITLAAPLLESTLQQSAEISPDRARMVFYLGDGEQTAEEPPVSFAPVADLIDGGAVFGYGTSEGGPMRLVMPGSGDNVPYLEDSGVTALSVIDEDALRGIADDLGVPYVHRDAGAEASFPDAPRTTTGFADVQSPGARRELAWMIGIVVSGLLLWELATSATRLRRTLHDSAERDGVA
ncbi:VWA domain-containing protein [Microbacterium amylolyticum]|uniref:Ca-activated chloride channel family protein n=1 Tax=Microbacterium amylolyticum TaxID=936337 RepID=A0ABS4ZI14_9MICO|nr:VWA domain-containing protein [Microbacterium amylolyticum]MBP2436917.1 Ca-activated chloride channel family protein [Microbacterium amylolyticum]